MGLQCVQILLTGGVQNVGEHVVEVIMFRFGVACILHTVGVNVEHTVIYLPGGVPFLLTVHLVPALIDALNYLVKVHHTNLSVDLILALALPSYGMLHRHRGVLIHFKLLTHHILVSIELIYHRVDILDLIALGLLQIRRLVNMALSPLMPFVVAV